MEKKFSGKSGVKKSFFSGKSGVKRFFFIWGNQGLKGIFLSGQFNCPDKKNTGTFREYKGTYSVHNVIISRGMI